MQNSRGLPRRDRGSVAGVQEVELRCERSLYTLPWRGGGASIAKPDEKRGGVNPYASVPPPRSLISFAIDPPPPGEGDGPAIFHRLPRRSQQARKLRKDRTRKRQRRTN